LIGSITAPSWSAGGSIFQTQEYFVDVNGDVRVKIARDGTVSGTSTVNIDDICLKDYTGIPTVATPTFTPPAGILFAPQNVTISCATEGHTIHYTIDGTDPTPSSPVYSTPIPVSAAITIKALAVKTGMTHSSIATAAYTFPSDVPNIAAFKAAHPFALNVTYTTHYRITGDVTFVFKNGRNIYIKDATGGLLIFDNNTPVVTTSYNHGDVISGGVIGTCTIYNGLYEMIPASNPASGTPGMPVEPTVLPMATLLANFYDYESQLVKLEEVRFNEGTFGTGNAGNINIYQNSSQMI
jgi:hypothetical protein